MMGHRQVEQEARDPPISLLSRGTGSFGKAAAPGFTTLPPFQVAISGLHAITLDVPSVSRSVRIRTSHIDAKPATTGDDSFSWIGSSKFSGTAGQLHYVSEHGSTIVEGDVNGDRIADFQIELKGKVALSASDFLL